MNVYELTHFCASIWNLFLPLPIQLTSTHPNSLCSVAIHSMKSFLSFQEEDLFASVTIQSRACLHVKFSICKQQNPFSGVQAESDLLKDIGWLPEFGGGMENQVWMLPT